MNHEAASKPVGALETKPEIERASGRGMVLGSLAAVASVLAALGCCLPVLPFVVAAGFAGGSAFLSAARPYLVAAAILSIAFGFFQAWRAKKCRRRPSALGLILLWTAAAVVFVSLFFPQVMANAAADLLGR